MASHKNLKNKKLPKVENGKQINTRKQVHTQIKDPVSYESFSPAWSFKRMQQETKWIFPPDELMYHSDNCIDSKCVISKLAEFEKMKWRDIKQQQHGHKGKSSNHFIEDFTKLDTYARSRLADLRITENFFSLRLEGKVRIFGILQSRTFEILWYDNKHEIYPVCMG